VVAEGRVEDVAQLVIAGGRGDLVDGVLLPKRFISERFDAFESAIFKRPTPSTIIVTSLMA
jgi:hypothetical protein